MKSTSGLGLFLNVSLSHSLNSMASVVGVEMTSNVRALTYVVDWFPQSYKLAFRNHEWL